jgi:predicted transcriptional regulator
MENIEENFTFENVLGSKGRCKIIKLLALKTELNISEIVKQTRLNHIDVKKHLAFLELIDFVQEKKYGRIKIYRFKEENLKAKSLKNLILFWEKEYEFI